LQQYFSQETKTDLPKTCPKKKAWYDPMNFFPWRAGDDVGFQALSKTEQEVYRQLCKHSYLTKKNYRRRYIAITNDELAKKSNCSEKTVRVAIDKILKSRLAIRWHKGTSQTGNSRYELPASLAQILFWRINFHKHPKP
jgi:hypothetical protein